MGAKRKPKKIETVEVRVIGECRVQFETTIQMGQDEWARIREVKEAPGFAAREVLRERLEDFIDLDRDAYAWDFDFDSVEAATSPETKEGP